VLVVLVPNKKKPVRSLGLHTGYQGVLLVLNAGDTTTPSFRQRVEIFEIQSAKNISAAVLLLGVRHHLLEGVSSLLRLGNLSVKQYSHM